MSSRTASHLRSNVVGYVALFFALGLGTAWALETNSVKSKHIVNDAVKGKDIDESTLAGVNADAVDGASECTGTTVVSTAGPGSADLCVLGNITLRGSCGGNLNGAITLDTTENDVFYGSRGDSPFDDGDFDAADPAVDLVTESHPSADGQSTASPPMNLYAAGPSGTMGGTAGLRVYNNGPGDQVCVFATAISMQPGA